MNSLDVEQLYKPRDIARLGLIKNSKNSDDEDANYQFILALIKAGRLKAIDYGLSDRHFWQVSGAEIKRYKEQFK